MKKTLEGKTQTLRISSAGCNSDLIRRPQTSVTQKGGNNLPPFEFFLPQG
ncbi:hypothetical protein [Lacimicrobium sp. SS2-24]|nr:hypothetical protein [Lacimicrobium sp. SS2-24]